MKMFLANKLLLEKVSPMLLIKFDFQLLREAATSFNIKPHQKHFFFLYYTPKHANIKIITTYLSDFRNTYFTNTSFNNTSIFNSNPKQSLKPKSLLYNPIRSKLIQFANPQELLVVSYTKQHTDPPKEYKLLVLCLSKK